MADEIKSISNMVLLMVLAQGNKEQNQHYAPRVFTQHYQLASEWLKDECVKQYPNAQIIIDLISPYMKKEVLPVLNGKIKKPKVYRNLLGFGFYVNEKEEPEEKDYTTFKFEDKFKFKDSANPTVAELETITANANATSRSLDMVTIGEWNYFLNHAYKKPKTFKKAKGCILEDGFVEVRPMNIPYVEIRYIKTTPAYKYGYLPLPDDTFVFDQKSTVEELWNENAIPYLVKAVNLLYANYVKDKDYIASAIDLRDNSLF